MLQSFIAEGTPREVELLANLEFALIKLAEATNYISFLGGDSSAVKSFADSCHVNHYLEQHGVEMVDIWKIVPPEFTYPVS